MARNPHQGDGVTSVEQMVGDGQRAVEQQEVTRWCSAARQNVEHRPRVAQQVEVRRRAAAPDFAKLEQAQMDGKQLSDAANRVLVAAFVDLEKDGWMDGNLFEELSWYTNSSEL